MPGKPGVLRRSRSAASLLDHAAAIGADLQAWSGVISPPIAIGKPPAMALVGRRRRTRVRRSWPILTAGAIQCVMRRRLSPWTVRSPTELPVTMQAIRPGLIETELPGVSRWCPGKPAIVLDVGHNPQAVKVLADNLSRMGFSTAPGRRRHAERQGYRRRAGCRWGKVDVWHVATLGGGFTRDGAKRWPCHHRGGGLGGERGLPPTPLRRWQAPGQTGESDRIVAFGSFYTVAAPPSRRPMRKQTEPLADMEDNDAICS